MKKLGTSVLSAVLAASLIGCSAGSTSTSGKYTAGTYTGEAEGHSSTVKVTAEFTADAIKSVTLDVSGETESIGGVAADQLIENIMNAQSADFDVVSGATETSSAVQRALQSAIDQATGTETTEKTAVADGTYEAEAASFGITGLMKGEVTFADGLKNLIPLLHNGILLRNPH